ncbi:CubicO group peptidase (beta-lactamase class C family) [Povalibacter uvarum]|uniref:CubicO group peptidase (Beta-lactamase class C family) n=1 Tax=Povalibacter uvarum TaxID=732238 RepID=A0A841HGJ3_9GAMM|nr:serine hydrolase domain-containing protein [Povalibacter uvarum]MBB6092241.1 CubicO group peptidase (beta-lactamase class C family) [Povalibacter uvarum]
MLPIGRRLPDPAIPVLLMMFSLLAGCSGGGSGDSPDEPEPQPPASAFAQVDAAANAAFVTQGMSGMGLAIYDASGAKVFERMYGTFSADQRVAIASASKMVAGTTIFRLIDKGYLSLDSTTGEVLGWTGEKGTITVRHLLSFTSGLGPENLCTVVANLTLAQCVDTIEQQDLVATPGTRFDYGSTHLQVAARMAEVRVGSAWNDIFAAELLQPLALPADIRFYSQPLQADGTTNPLIAGGLRMSMNEYGRILQFIFDKGRWQGSALMQPTLFDLQNREPYPDVVIGQSPAVGNGFAFRYGLTAWLECSTPATGCADFSSPGAFGFTPWIDRQSGYFAILGMELRNNSSGIVSFAVSLEQQLKPLIAEAVR